MVTKKSIENTLRSFTVDAGRVWRRGIIVNQVGPLLEKVREFMSEINALEDPMDKLELLETLGIELKSYHSNYLRPINYSKAGLICDALYEEIKNNINSLWDLKKVNDLIKHTEKFIADVPSSGLYNKIREDLNGALDILRDDSLSYSEKIANYQDKVITSFNSSKLFNKIVDAFLRGITKIIDSPKINNLRLKLAVQEQREIVSDEKSALLTNEGMPKEEVQPSFSGPTPTS